MGRSGGEYGTKQTSWGHAAGQPSELTKALPSGLTGSLLATSYLLLRRGMVLNSSAHPAAKCLYTRDLLSSSWQS